MRFLACVGVLVCFASCNCGDGGTGMDAGKPTDGGGGSFDAGTGSDAGAPMDAGVDAGTPVDAGVDAGSPVDAGLDAGMPLDAGTDAGELDAGVPIVYSCASFTQPAGWQVATGYRAVEVANRDAGLDQPVALVFAGGAYGGSVYVVNQGSDNVVRLDPGLRASVFTPSTGFTPPTALLTAIVWDSASTFDGQLYVADQGSDSDQDSRVYRISPSGTSTLFATAPLPAFDDIYAMVFTPRRPEWPQGMLVSGDTDTAAIAQWSLVSADGGAVPFSPIAGVEGACVDDDVVLASRPASGGYAGDNTITRVLPDGGNGGTILSGLNGVHAVVKAPPGPFGGKVYAASWSTQQVFSVEADGGIGVIASGLGLTNYGANALAFSPDGTILLVADRAASRVVCIERGP